MTVVAETGFIAVISALTHWKRNDKSTSYTFSTRYGKAPAMPVDNVLDDGKSKTGSPLIAGAVRVDSIKPFGQTRDMVLGDAFALVADLDNQSRGRSIQPFFGILKR